MFEEPIKRKVIYYPTNFKSKVSYSFAENNSESSQTFTSLDLPNFTFNHRDESQQQQNEKIKHRYHHRPIFNKDLLENPRIVYQDKYLKQTPEPLLQEQPGQIKINKTQQIPLNEEKKLVIRDRRVSTMIRRRLGEKKLAMNSDKKVSKEFQIASPEQHQQKGVILNEEKEEKKTPKKNMKFGYYIEEGRLKSLESKINNYLQRKQTNVSVSEKKPKKVLPKIITIYFTTTKDQLVSIFKSCTIGEKVRLNIRVPKVIFSLNSKTMSFYEKVQQVCQVLQILIENVTIQKSKKTLFIGDRKKCLIYEKEKMYIGEWKKGENEKRYRNGLGMEWIEGRHAFFGEFCMNRKNGIGTMKKEGEGFMGYWSDNLKTTKMVRIKEEMVEDVNLGTITYL